MNIKALSSLLTFPLFLALLAPMVRAEEQETESLFEDAINRGEEVSMANPLARASVFLMIGSKGAEGQMIGFCTGTLIEKDLVLTAAHCLKGENTEAVIVAAITSSKKAIKAAAWKVHPEFDARVRNGFLGLNRRLVVMNDIALIKLSQPTDSTSLIAKLPATNLNEAQEYNLIPAGYGKSDGTPDSKPGTFRSGQTRGRLVAAENGASQHILMTSGAMTCQGDSGGPIFLTSKAGLVVVGVTSHGDKACETKSVASSVGYHLKWIRSARALLR